MARCQNHGLNTYEALDKFLGKRTEKKYGKNCVISRGKHKISDIQKNDNAIFVRLYSTNIVIHLEIGEQIINNGGWNTQTTKRYIDGFSH